MIFVGIDVGTQGVRGIAADENGRVLAGAHREYKNINLAPEEKLAEGWREQDPEDWWLATCAVLAEMNLDIDITKAATICVDGTSGTIAAVDMNGEPLCNALMYNDARGKGGRGIPKMLWLKEHLRGGADGPVNTAQKPYRFVHQADYIVGKLTGNFGITDWSNALKSGYDARKEKWTDEAIAAFNAPPSVVPVGTVIGKWQGVDVVAGASDGYMSAVATCAVRPGEWASIIGTTLVLKGVTENYIDDPSGCVYCHKHPEGYWMPGGASNVGARCINEWFIPEGADSDKMLRTLNSKIENETPTGLLEYPLLVPGERFPFLDGSFSGFGSHNNYTAVIEGISFVERLCFEKLEELGCTVGEHIYSTGGACRSDEWLKLRANILGKTIKVPMVTDAAIGGAMLGAAAVHYGGLIDAAAHMGRFAKIVEPDSAHDLCRVKTQIIKDSDNAPAKCGKDYDGLYEEFKNKISEIR